MQRKKKKNYFVEFIELKVHNLKMRLSQLINYRSSYSRSSTIDSVIIRDTHTIRGGLHLHRAHLQ